MQVYIGKLHEVAFEKGVNLYGGIRYVYKLSIGKRILNLYKGKKINFRKDRDYILIYEDKLSVVYKIERYEKRNEVLKNIRKNVVYTSTLSVSVFLLTILYSIFYLSGGHAFLFAAIFLIFVFPFLYMSIFRSEKAFRELRSRISENDQNV